MPNADSPDQQQQENLRQHLRAAQGYAELEMWEDAWNELDLLAPDERALVPVAMMRLEILVAMKRYESAAILGESLIARGIREKQAYLLCAYSLRRCRSLKAAERVLLSGSDILNDEALWHYNLACYASVAGRIDEAKERLRRAFEIDPRYRITALDDPDLDAVWACS